MSKRQTIALLLLSTSLMTAFTPMLFSYALTEGMNPREIDDGNPNPNPGPESGPDQPGPPGPPILTGGTSLESYTSSVGLTDPAKIGEERWFLLCDFQAQQGAVTLNSGSTETCTRQMRDGWQIVEHEVEVVTNKHNRGSYTTNIIEKDGQFSANEQEIGSKWKLAIEKAIKAGDFETQKKLELEYQRNMQLIKQYSSNKNTLFAKITANGGLFRKSLIHIKVRVKAVRIA
jgi:hypothetical protein